MYLKRHPNSVYYYRRPITAEDQAFWLAPNGKPKKEWGMSLRTTDRRTAIERMRDAADRYTAERDRQLAEYTAPPTPQSMQQQEEQAALLAVEAARLARFNARQPERVKARQLMRLATVELNPEQAAWRDLVREWQVEAKAAQKQPGNLQETRLADLGVPGFGKEPPAGATSDHTVEDLITAYEADKSPGWSGSSKKAVIPVFRFLRDVFPGRRLGSITREEARQAVKLLEALPLYIGRRKEFKGMTIPQAIERGRRLNLPTIQPKTVNDSYLLHIASMFNWACKEQWLSSTPFTGLAVHDPIDDADRRDPFTIDQLKSVFASGPWKAPWKAGNDKAGDYWVPLLCLLHGFRNAEAAGLRVEDIGEDDGIPVIRIRAYSGRRIKNTGARGTLAMHPEMVRLGFLGHVSDRRQAGETQLFPEGIANSRGQAGAKLGERFSAYVKALNLTGRKLGMHSFRHNFEDRLREAELGERTALALARRTEAGSSKVYGDGLSAKSKADAIAKIRYPGLDFSRLHSPFP